MYVRRSPPDYAFSIFSVSFVFLNSLLFCLISTVLWGGATSICDGIIVYWLYGRSRKISMLSSGDVDMSSGLLPNGVHHVDDVHLMVSTLAHFSPTLSTFPAPLSLPEHRLIVVNIFCSPQTALWVTLSFGWLGTITYLTKLTITDQYWRRNWDPWNIWSESRRLETLAIYAPLWKFITFLTTALTFIVNLWLRVTWGCIRNSCNVFYYRFVVIHGNMCLYFSGLCLSTVSHFWFHCAIARASIAMPQFEFTQLQIIILIFNLRPDNGVTSRRFLLIFSFFFLSIKCSSLGTRQVCIW